MKHSAHNLFKPGSFEEGKHAVVGSCNGFLMDERYALETPAFADQILSFAKGFDTILDYGCGVGRLMKEILNKDDTIFIDGLDASSDMLKLTRENIENDNGIIRNLFLPETLDNLPNIKYNIIYCVYVLQHCPAIEIRDVLRRIHRHLEPGGKFIYCSSDYRMAIRFDGKGFFDDRFLGVDLRAEIDRFFNVERQLFMPEDIAKFDIRTQQILNTMIFGEGLPHPAYVYTKKENVDSKRIAVIKVRDAGIKTSNIEAFAQSDDLKDLVPKEPQKLILVNDLAPGDILLTSIAIRSIHKAHPNRYITDVRSPANELFLNNMYITPITNQNPEEEREVIEKLKKNEHLGPQMSNGIIYVIAHYPEIHRSGMTGSHFTDGHRLFLAKQLGIDIPATGMQPELYLTDGEKLDRFGIGCRYWVINAGIKDDYTLKQYPYYQEVVNILKDQITFVQIGHNAHNHKPLDGVIDMRGKTNLRQLASLIYNADGVITCISLPMHLAACWNKPCVVPAGAREGTRWELYPNQQFLYMNGCMSCSNENGDGCWKSRINDCINKTEHGHAKCMAMIEPYMVADAVMNYYEGGRLGKIKNQTGVEIKEIYEDESKFQTEILDMPQEGHFYNLPQINSAIFNVMRILKGVTPQDDYYERYLQHFEKRGDSFMDTYHFMWYLGSVIKPKRILEIGSRAGISICQLLSACISYDHIDKIVLCDLFVEEPGSPATIVKNLNALNIWARIQDKVKFIKGDSTLEIPKLSFEGNKYSSILVDGCHEKSYALTDLRNAVNLVEKDGFIIFDDLTEDGCSLQDVWDTFKSENKSSFSFWENHDGKGIGYARKL